MSATAESTHETVLQATGARARLARVYAEALLACAAKSNSVDSVGAELKQIVTEIVGHFPKIGSFFGNPTIRAARKQPVLDAALANAVSPLMKNFLELLNQNHRLGILRDIQAAYQAICDSQAGRIRVLVRSATALNDGQLAQLKSTLAGKLGKDPVLATSVEPELLGGLIVQIGDRVYDTSVRTRLDNLRNHLLTSGNHGA
jgi:F-type H+-transporting ATPase subunit delta